MSITTPATPPRLFTFIAGDTGPWTVQSARTLVGDDLPPARCLRVEVGAAATHCPAGSWSLAGITSNDRYVERHEKAALVSVQAGIGRAEATCAALIPIRKSPAWWALTQDERRAVFEAQSHHIAIGLRYLPEVARRLHHCRDLGAVEPFDFLTWFDYAPAHESAFDDLLAALRASPEWAYVDREIDIRLVRDGA
jgi:chlorite dismutase